MFIEKFVLTKDKVNDQIAIVVCHSIQNTLSIVDEEMLNDDASVPLSEYDIDCDSGSATESDTTVEWFSTTLIDEAKDEIVGASFTFEIFTVIACEAVVLASLTFTVTEYEFLVS